MDLKPFKHTLPKKCRVAMAPKASSEGPKTKTEKRSLLGTKQARWVTKSAHGYRLYPNLYAAAHLRSLIVVYGSSSDEVRKFREKM